MAVNNSYCCLFSIALTANNNAATTTILGPVGVSRNHEAVSPPTTATQPLKLAPNAILEVSPELFELYDYKESRKLLGLPQLGHLFRLRRALPKYTKQCSIGSLPAGPRSPRPPTPIAGNGSGSGPPSWPNFLRPVGCTNSPPTKVEFATWFPCEPANGDSERTGGTAHHVVRG